MGLISKEIDVKVWGINLRHYLEKGYIIPTYKNKFNQTCYILGSIIKVRVDDLPEKANNLIEVECDFCGKIKPIRYQTFTRMKNVLNTGKYYCQSCNAKVNTRLPINEVINRVISLGEGYKLLNPEEYENSESPLTILCDKGHKYTTTMQSVRQGCKCSVCWEEKNKIRWLGDANPNYNPNLTDEERYQNRDTLEIVEWRRDVYHRDNYTCQCCGQYQGRLNAHHLDGYDWCIEKRTDVENGITFCEDCHKGFHHIYGYGNNIKDQTIEYLKSYGKLTDEDRKRIRENARQLNKTKVHLDKEEVIQIKWMLQNTDLTQEEIKSIMKLKGACITYIKNNKSYSYIQINQDYIPPKNLLKLINHIVQKRKEKVRSFAKLSVIQVKEIKRLIWENITEHKEIADMYGITGSAIQSIKSGRIWSQVEIEEATNEQIKKIVRGKRSVIQLTINGEFVKEWNNTKEAAEFLGITNKIPEVCKGKRNKTGGYRWMYKEDYDQYISQQQINS